MSNETATLSPFRVKFHLGFDALVGYHRIQRVPETEKKGRRHSSFVFVTLSGAKPSVSVDLSGVVKTNYKSSGAGGQHRNKTMTGVRLQHPSGLIVTNADTRSEKDNSEKAYAELKRRLVEAQQSELHESARTAKNAQMSAESWTWTEWRDEVVERSTGRRAKMSRLLKGKGFELFN